MLPLQSLQDLLISFGAFVAIVTTIVFFHELGHYLVAKNNGIPVESFSIGFGPEIIGWTNKEGTRWKLSMIPFGGYIKIKNYEIDENNVEKEIEYSSKKLFFVDIAGPIANFIFAAFLWVFGTIRYGIIVTLPVISGFMADGPAKKSGLEINDKILAIDGKKIDVSLDVYREIKTSINPNLHFTVLRDGKSTEVVVKRGKEKTIGVMFRKTEIRRGELFWDIAEAFERVYDEIVKSFSGFMSIFGGDRMIIGGPISIAGIAGGIVKEGGICSILAFVAFLSVNLGCLNLFPLPGLDGGNAVIHGLETIIGKKMSPGIRNVVSIISFAFVCLLIGFTIVLDLRRIVG